MQIPEHWTHEDNMLKREIRCADFSTAFAFMTQVAMLAEQAARAVSGKARKGGKAHKLLVEGA